MLLDAFAGVAHLNTQGRQWCYLPLSKFIQLQTEKTASLHQWGYHDVLAHLALVFGPLLTALMSQPAKPLLYFI